MVTSTELLNFRVDVESDHIPTCNNDSMQPDPVQSAKGPVLYLCTPAGPSQLRGMGTEPLTDSCVIDREHGLFPSFPWRYQIFF